MATRTLSSRAPLRAAPFASAIHGAHCVRNPPRCEARKLKPHLPGAPVTRPRSRLRPVGRPFGRRLHRLQRVSDVPDTLHDGEGGERGHRVDRGSQQLDVEDAGPFREDEADGQYDHSDGARGDTDLALHAQRLGPGTGVGDHQRAEHDDHAHRGGELVAGLGEAVGDRGEHDPLLDPVQGRIEEGAEQRALARGARVAAVERVHHRAEDEGDAAEEVVALPDQHRRGEVADQARPSRSRSASAETRSGGCGRRPRLLGGAGYGPHRSRGARPAPRLRRSAAAAREPLEGPVGVEPRRAGSRCPPPRRPRAPRRAASIQKWLPLATTT